MKKKILIILVVISVLIIIIGLFVTKSIINQLLDEVENVPTSNTTVLSKGMATFGSVLLGITMEFYVFSLVAAIGAVYGIVVLIMFIIKKVKNKKNNKND